MPITPVNATKNTISPAGSIKAGVYVWGDTIATWGDALATWGNYAISASNQTKNSTTPTNQTKS